MKYLRIKDIMNVNRGASPRPISNQEYFSEKGIYGWVRISDVTRSNKYLTHVDEYLSDLGSSFSVKLDKETLFLSIAGSVGKACINKIPVCIHDGFVYFSRIKNYDIDYLFWFFSNSRIYEGLGKKGVFLNLNIDTIKNIMIPKLSKNKQLKISNFLNENCSKIDSEISLLEKKSELLEEYKQSLIFETITKGLDKNVEMKDSGIDWIGKTPKHWKIKRIKNIFNSLGGGNYGEDENVGMINLPCISISDFKNGNIINTDKIVSFRSYNKDNKLKKGTILLEKSGGGEKNPVGRVIYLLNDINAHYTNFVQGLKSVEDSKFSYYLMKSIHSNKFHINFVKQNTGLQNFNYNGFSKLFFVSIPPKNEQIDIVNFLDEETQKIENKIALISKKIELLKEYKQSLIHEAVTGQLEI